MNLPARVEQLPGAPPPPFQLNPKQRFALDLIGSDARHVLLYGGSRSGKTFMLVRALISRALLAAGSRHLMARFRLAHINASIVADTWIKVMRLCFPGLSAKVKHNKAEHCFTFPNGSEVWYAGLDDKERTEKILGLEFVTVLLEECSQIPWASRELLMTRLAQLVLVDSTQQPMRLKALYSENPPLKSHWTYKLFIQKVSPDNGRRLVDDAIVGSLLLNPIDNKANVSPEYMQMLDELGERRRKRFRDGLFGEAGEAALWTVELLEQQQWDVRKDIPIEHMLRVVIGVDPSGASNIDDAHRDEIGIVAAAILNDGSALVLEDATMKGSPAEWGEAVVACAERWDVGSGVTIVGEENYGGAMVRFVVQSAMTKAKRTFRYMAVTATKGKVVRAEPISAIYEQANVKHLPGMALLEDELCQMTTFGYTGDRSPNRADAAIWALTALFPSVIKAGKEQARSGGTPRVNLGHAQAKAKSRRR